MSHISDFNQVVMICWPDMIPSELGVGSMAGTFSDDESGFKLELGIDDDAGCSMADSLVCNSATRAF